MSDCLFCGLIAKKANVLYEDERVFAMLAPEPAAIGHVVVLPKQHAPIFESVPDFVVSDLFRIANKASVSIFESLGAQGTNLVVQSGESAGQRHNHAMVHVIPRFENDNLPIGWNPSQTTPEQLAKMESAIKDEAKSVGSFEKEKPKPVEKEPPKEVPKEDLRLKQLRRRP